MSDERLSVRTQVLLWTAQRASAAVLAVCVIVHLVTIIYAVRNGLSAAEILGRTRGSGAWAAFYALFVAAVAVHAPIGLRNILSELFGWRGRSLEITVLALAVLLAFWGFRAVYAVFVCARRWRPPHEERLPSAQPPGILGFRGAPRVRPAACAVPASAFLGARPGVAGRSEAGGLPALVRAAAHEIRGNGAGVAARGAHDRRLAAARTR